MAAVSRTLSASLAFYHAFYTSRSQCERAKRSSPRGKARTGRQLTPCVSDKQQLKRGVRENGNWRAATIEAETVDNVEEETRSQSSMSLNALEAQRVVQQLRIGYSSGRALEESLGPLIERLCNQRTFGLVMKELGRENWGDTAGKVLSFLRSAGRTPDTRAHSEVLRALGRAGQSDACVALLGQMTSSGPAPDVWCYSEVLKALARKEKFEEVLAVFEEMNENGVAPSVWCYNVVVTALCKRGSLREAQALLQHLRGERRRCENAKMAEESKTENAFAKEEREDSKGRQLRVGIPGVTLSDESTAVKGGEESAGNPEARERLLANGQRNLGATQRGGNLAAAGKHSVTSDVGMAKRGPTSSSAGLSTSSKQISISLEESMTQSDATADPCPHSEAQQTERLHKACPSRNGMLAHAEPGLQSTSLLNGTQKGEAARRTRRSDIKEAPEPLIEEAQGMDASETVVEVTVKIAGTSSPSLALAKEASGSSTDVLAHTSATSAQEAKRAAQTTQVSAAERNGLAVLRRAILGHRSKSLKGSAGGYESPELRDLGKEAFVSIHDAVNVGSLDVRNAVEGASCEDGSEGPALDLRAKSDKLADGAEGRWQVDSSIKWVNGDSDKKNAPSSGEQQERDCPRGDAGDGQRSFRRHLPSSGFATERHVRSDLSGHISETADGSILLSPPSESADAAASMRTVQELGHGRSRVSYRVNGAKSADRGRRGRSAKLRWRGLKTTEDWPPPPSPDAVTYNILIGACAEKPDGWKAAVDLLRCMKEDGVEPTRITYNSVLITCSRAGRWRHCLDCWNALETANLARDDFALSCVVRALGAVKRCDKAVEMVQAAWRGAFKRECRPSIQTCNMVVSACAQQKQWRAAIAFIRWMQTETRLVPDVGTYNAAVQACLNAGEAQQALQLYCELLRRGLRPDSHSQTLYISTLTSCGHHVAALEAFWAFRSGPGVSSPITYNAAIVACGKGLLWLDAFKVFQNMDTSNVTPTLVTYESLIKALCDCGEVEKARAVFQAMGPRGFKPRVRTFNNLLHGFARENRWEEARAIFDSMLRFGVRPDTISYNILMRAYRRGGQFQAVVSMFVSMQEGTWPPDDVTFREVLTACDQGGLGSEAMWALERMDAWGIEPADFHYSRALVASARGGAWEDVEELYQYMKEEGMELDGTLFMAMLARLEVEGSTERAQGLLNEWRETANDFEIGPGGYNLVLGALGSVGMWQEALNWKELMVARGVTPNVTTYSMLVGVLEKCGRWKEAMAVYGQMPMTGGVVEPAKTTVADES